MTRTWMTELSRSCGKRIRSWGCKYRVKINKYWADMCRDQVNMLRSGQPQAEEGQWLSHFSTSSYSSISQSCRSSWGIKSTSCSLRMPTWRRRWRDWGRRRDLVSGALQQLQRILILLEILLQQTRIVSSRWCRVNLLSQEIYIKFFSSLLRQTSVQMMIPTQNQTQ